MEGELSVVFVVSWPSSWREREREKAAIVVVVSCNGVFQLGVSKEINNAELHASTCRFPLVLNVEGFCALMLAKKQTIAGNTGKKKRGNSRKNYKSCFI